MYPVWLVGAAYFCLGLIFGSFLNVCIYRLPRGLSVVRPRSACPECHQMISAQDNIPVISWLLLGGRCRHCKAPITPRYALSLIHIWHGDGTELALLLSRAQTGRGQQGRSD